MTKRRQRLSAKRAEEKRIVEQVTRALLGEFAVGDRVQVVPKQYFPNRTVVKGRITRIIEIDNNQHFSDCHAYQIRLDEQSNALMENCFSFWASHDMLKHIGTGDIK